MPETARRHLSKLDLTGRSFLTIHDFTPAEVVTLLDLAAASRTCRSAASRTPSSRAAPSP